MTLAVVLAAALVAVACGSDGASLSEGLPPPELTNTVADSTEIPPVEPTIRQLDTGSSLDITFTGAGAVEGEPTREGWREVNVFLDVEYGGGLDVDRLKCAGDGNGYAALRAFITPPNGSGYPLVANLADTGCVMQLVPGLKMRLAFTAEIPTIVSSIEGSTVEMLVGSGMWLGRANTEELLYEDSFATGDPVPFRQARPPDSALKLGEEVSFERETVDGLRVGTLEFLSAGLAIALRWSREVAQVNYRFVNNSPYDAAAPVGDGILIDGRGFPYRISGSGCRKVAPGYEEICSLQTNPLSGPMYGQPDLSSFTVATGEYIVSEQAGE